MSKGDTSRSIQVRKIPEEEGGGWRVRMNARRMAHLEMLCRATDLTPADYVGEMIEVGFVRTEEIAKRILGPEPTEKPAAKPPPPRGRPYRESVIATVWNACAELTEPFRYAQVRALVPETEPASIAQAMKSLTKYGRVRVLEPGRSGRGGSPLFEVIREKLEAAAA